MTTPIRCAIYTRKSSEEGLDLAFNSLDAQREAGIDYVKSQKHQGWIALDAMYDDGGYSGGSTDRPGLRRLLDDIQRGRVDIVLVYKVDRLSRSLADFARLMQVFDEHKVSFVSVTQQFNTTTSMGRLTLNMLLSFAQFEREVAGERIRDKIAATKRKGIWICGQPPLGYAVAREGEPGFVPGSRSLRIVESEAHLVRSIYAGYLETGSLVRLAARMRSQSRRTKAWVSSKGVQHGGDPFTTAHLYRILSNPLYIGKVTHKRGKGADAPVDVWPGLHEAIIEQETWDTVRASMDLADKRARSLWTHTHLLKSKIRTDEGYAMSPGSVQRRPTKARADSGGVDVVRYYISQKAIKHGYASCPIKTINAGHLDDLVRALVLDHLRLRHALDLRALPAPARDQRLRDILELVEVASDRLVVTLIDTAIASCLAELAAERKKPGSSHEPRRDHDTTIEPSPTCLFAPEAKTESRRDGPRTMLTLAIAIKRHDGKRLLLSPDGRDLLTSVTAQGDGIPRPHLVRAIAQAHAWRDHLLPSGKPIARTTIPAVARGARVTPTRVKLLLPLAHLAPAITGAALSGTLPASITLKDLHAAAKNLDWNRQAEFLGLPVSTTTSHA